MTGCQSLYVPNARNSPMFRKGGEVQGAVAYGNGLDIQGAVAVSNHIGLMANYHYENIHPNKYFSHFDEDEYQFHKFFEGGIGYYGNRQNWFYEIFAGYGRGQASSYDSYDFLWVSGDMQATGKYERVFIQPAFGMNKKIFHFSIAPRISIVDFKEFSSDATLTTMDVNPTVFFEPAFLGRVNLMNNHFFLGFQAGFSLPAANDVIYDYRAAHISAGLGFRVGGIHENRKGSQ